MQRFRVNLKKFLGYCHDVTKLILGWFVGGIFRQETLIIPIGIINVHINTLIIEQSPGRLQKLIITIREKKLHYIVVWWLRGLVTTTTGHINENIHALLSHS